MPSIKQKTPSGKCHKPRVAFILAGGKGLRMRRLGEFLPKCTLVIYDQPLLIRQIETCRKLGINEVIISVANKNLEVIQSIVEKVEDVRISLHIDKDPKGPIMALASERSDLEGRSFLFLLGDIYLERDDFFHAIETFPESDIVISTYIERDQQRISAGCNIVAKDRTVLKIQEKPKECEISGNLAWTGISVLPPDFYSKLSKIPNATLRAFQHVGELFQFLLVNGTTASHFVENGLVCNLTTPNDLLYANIVELKKICRTRPKEMEDSWKRIRETIDDS